MNTYICVFFLLLGHKANHFHLVFPNFSLFLFFDFWKKGTNFKRGVGRTQPKHTSIQNLYVVGEPMYIFSENGSEVGLKK